MGVQQQDVPEKVIGEIPESKLERIFIDAYITGKGYELDRLHELPEAEYKQLMIDASMYASAKLAELETRAHFVKEIHDASHSVTP